MEAMTEVKLPEPMYYSGSGERFGATVVGYYTAGQMRAAILAERERCALICESVNNHENPMTAGDCADAIRKGA